MTKTEHLLKKAQWENRRLRWSMSQRVSADGERTMLEEFDEINPEWIDAMIDGGRHPLPSFYREIV